jgi:hypothetical protein
LNGSLSVSLFGGEGQRVGKGLEVVGSDEGQRVELATPRVLLADDEHLDVGLGLVAHEVEEGELGLEKVLVALLGAVEEEFGGRVQGVGLLG